ncbi:hypothetical protein GCM10011611_63610 [Aliidongia dinghuensis]|uniref:XRE family transcriptional regulator n=1 Tax=Aliidongia dinghuensis TaxID=1867774 RepID=A0A8J3E7S2_9PROT|nr:hypothetical protein GCM10011611_63610 [Aliidongia dinghuensis]
MGDHVTTENLLGTYQKDRRRTPGPRREEVAQRANISPTWYTWLEQGRGGTAPRGKPEGPYRLFLERTGRKI